MEYNIDYNNAIPELIVKKFNVKQMKYKMYEKGEEKTYTPRLLFFLKPDEKEKECYEHIRMVVEQFEENLKWCFKDAVGSKK
jgi:hypothetical protein